MVVHGSESLQQCLDEHAVAWLEDPATMHEHGVLCLGSLATMPPRAWCFISQRPCNIASTSIVVHLFDTLQP